MTIMRRLWGIAVMALALALLLALPAGPVSAQLAPPAKSPFGVGPPPAERPLAPSASPAAAPPGLLQRAGGWLMQQQQLAHRELASAVRRFRSADPLSAALLLAAISFVYGVLHAAGPGHGKAVITSYVLADGQTVRRGILLSFLAALIQALSALVLVGVLILVLRSTGLQIRAMEAWLETLSWGLVALIGAWLVYYQLRALRAPAAHVHAHDHAHSDTHHYAYDGVHHHVHQHGRQYAHADAHAHAHRQHGHAHGHAHTHTHTHGAACEVCAHLPSPVQLKGDWSWRRALALAFAVGIRPCTGAILVLVFAIGQGLWWAGVFSTFAMALGTAMTVSALAALAVGSRELAKRLAGSSGSTRWADRVQTAAGLGGAALVLVLGAAFFVGSLAGGQPF
jgi:ABC-type nickel/cobalt efflux system permease component RcnA